MELQIQDVAFGGNGVARDNGKAVFIPYTIDREKVLARIVREKKHFAEGKLEEILEASPHRVTPECPYFGRCGGCSYQHIRYEHQLELKARQVEQTLRRIGHFTFVPMRPIVPSPKSYAYRNRITVHCQDEVIGFYRRDEHRLIDIEFCPIACAEVNEELKQLRASNPREGHYTLRLRSRHRTFSQTNDGVAELLLEHVANLVPEKGGILIDAFCGAGFFAKHLLNNFERIIGIDWDKFAIAEAKKNATGKEVYITGEVDLELAQVGAVHRTARGRLESIAPTSCTLIVDPPATGLTNAGRRATIDLAPDAFIYVSCNPSTLARDLAGFREHFTLKSVTPFDMFPQTAEIAVVAQLQAQSQ